MLCALLSCKRRPSPAADYKVLIDSSGREREPAFARQQNCCSDVKSIRLDDNQRAQAFVASRGFFREVKAQPPGILHMQAYAAVAAVAIEYGIRAMQRLAAVEEHAIRHRGAASRAREFAGFAASFAECVNAEGADSGAAALTDIGAPIAACGRHTRLHQFAVFIVRAPAVYTRVDDDLLFPDSGY